MAEPSLNETMLPQSTCIGCGEASTQGFHTRFYRDPSSNERLIGRVVVPDFGVGLPGLVQGGVLFTALDCLSGWTMFVLRNDIKAMPVTMSANVKYLKPARVGDEIKLIGTIKHLGTSPADPTVTHGIAMDSSGQPLAELESQLMMIPVAKFKKMTGLASLPEDYKKHFPDA